MQKKRHPPAREVELDYSAFMNLMIVLVPVLLMGMVLSRITEVAAALPAGAARETVPRNCGS